MTPIYSNTVMIRISSFDFPLDSFTQFGEGIGQDKTFQGMSRVQYMLDVITLVCEGERDKETRAVHARCHCPGLSLSRSLSLSLSLSLCLYICVCL